MKYNKEFYEKVFSSKRMERYFKLHSDENKALKASGAAPAAPAVAAAPAPVAPAAPAVDPALIASVDKIMKLSEEIAKENAILRSRISK